MTFHLVEHTNRITLAMTKLLLKGNQLCMVIGHPPYKPIKNELIAVYAPLNISVELV